MARKRIHFDVCLTTGTYCSNAYRAGCRCHECVAFKAERHIERAAKQSPPDCPECVILEDKLNRSIIINGNLRLTVRRLERDNATR